MDRRIKKTEEQILQGTLRLLQHEKMEELTVTEICNEANVSRSTFYLHYLEPKDIVEQLYNDVAVTLTNILDNYDLGSPDIRHSDFLNSIFEVLDMYKKYFVVLLTTGYHSNFRRRLKKILEDKVLSDNIYRYKNTLEIEYQISFMISGLVEVLCDNMEDMFDPKKREVLFKVLSIILDRQVRKLPN